MKLWAGLLQKAWYWFWQRMALFALSILFRLRVYGRDPSLAKGGLLIVSNHQSYLDPLLLGVGMPRQIKYMARRTLFRNPVFAWLIRSLNAVPISREGRDTGAMREAIRLLSEGAALVMFPEGTRTRDGEVGAVRGGMSVIAGRAGTPILPAALDGAWQALPRDSRGLRFTPIMVAFGRLIRAEEVARMTREDLEARVRSEIVALLRTLRARREVAMFRRRPRAVFNRQPGDGAQAAQQPGPVCERPSGSASRDRGRMSAPQARPPNDVCGLGGY